MPLTPPDLWFYFDMLAIGINICPAYRCPANRAHSCNIIHWCLSSSWVALDSIWWVGRRRFSFSAYAFISPAWRTTCEQCSFIQMRMKRQPSDSSPLFRSITSCSSKLLRSNEPVDCALKMVFLLFPVITVSQIRWIRLLAWGFSLGWWCVLLHWPPIWPHWTNATCSARALYWH